MFTGCSSDPKIETVKNAEAKAFHLTDGVSYGEVLTTTADNYVTWEVKKLPPTDELYNSHDWVEARLEFDKKKATVGFLVNKATGKVLLSCGKTELLEDSYTIEDCMMTVGALMEQYYKASGKKPPEPPSVFTKDDLD